MRYLGSKVKLLEFIERTIDKYNIRGQIFCDLFAGTSCVSDLFKDKYEIISNDFMYYSYCFSKAKLSFSCIPNFEKFQRCYKINIFDWLNNQVYDVNDYSFIYKNYTPEGGRMFFTQENAIRIGGIRHRIEQLYQNNEVNENEYYFLLASLLECITKYSNTSGTYEAFLKFWDKRALKKFKLEPIGFKQCRIINTCTCYNENSNSLIRKIQGDILYLDPPYTVTQYASAYNILETIALCDEPIIKGIGGKRNKGDCVSFYSYKNKAKEELEDIFRQAQFRYIIMSYSNQGVIPLEDIINLAKLFAKDRNVHVEFVEYQEYQNHRSSNKRNGKKLREVLICFEKDLVVRKSPLNYSGSKNTIFNAIQKYFPKHIGTFVDVMGGAFNVGINVYATKKVIYNDVNPYIYGIINWLLTNNKKYIVQSVEDVISKYNLSKADKKSYSQLRDVYNTTPSPLLLFVLHMYSFQNYIRFNKNQHFNTPIGVAGYSSDLCTRINTFIPKTCEVEIKNCNFKDIDWGKFPKDTLFYFDPPYCITQAAYNDGKRGLEGWTDDDDIILLETLCILNKQGYKFMLSNVTEHKGKVNNRLIDWANLNNFKVIELGISGWRYTKNEIIVINY